MSYSTRVYDVYEFVCRSEHAVYGRLPQRIDEVMGIGGKTFKTNEKKTVLPKDLAPTQKKTKKVVIVNESTPCTVFAIVRQKLLP